MADYRVDVVCSGTTATGAASTPSPIGVAPNPTRIINIGNPTVTTATVPDGTQNSAYTVTLNVVGGFAPYTWSLSSGTLPVGLSISSAGVISGTPTAIQTNVTFTVAVADHSGNSATKSFTMSIASAPVTNYGPHLGDWMIQSGDQVLTMPDGTYDTANLNVALSAHAATGGTYGGWLIIQAQNQGMAVIDGSTTGLRVGSPGATPRNLRIMFVGLKFLNVDWHSYNMSCIRWWYTEHTFPATAWKTQYITAGGDPTAALNSTVQNAMPNYSGAAIRVLGDVSPFANNIGVYGAYIHNMGDDGIFLQGASTGEIVGNKIVDVHHHNLFSPHDYFHSDAIQSEWGSNWTVSDNFIGGHIQFESAISNLANWTFRNNWHAGSPDLGFTYDTAPLGVQRDITGSSVSAQFWNNGQYYGYAANPQYWSDYDVFQYGFNNAPSGLTFSVTRLKPSSVTVVANLITDLPLQSSALADVTNPANVWQAAHVYSSWATYFATGRTLTDGVTTSGSATVTSATGNFQAGDVGKPIHGSGIPGGTYIGVRNSSTSIGLSSSPSSNVPVNASASGSSVTLTIASGGWV